MTEIHDLNLTDTEYAALAAQGYDPHLEQQLIALGEDPDCSRTVARLIGLLKGKTLETQEEWEEFMATWEGACGYQLNARTATGK